MGMKFALFYEIPVARPWDAESEHRAYKNTLEQAVLGDQVGFHSFWTVEHHFLEEYSHCSNPEVLYGAIAARTKNIRIGYGVRLLPKPYNHPIRTAESVAVLDLLSDGRVEFGTGRSSTRAELEGFDIDPHETRAMWSEALEHIVGAWTEETYQADGQVLAAWARPGACSRSRCRSRTRRCGARRRSPDGHREIGRHGLGLCSFTVGVPPEELAERIDAVPPGPRRVHEAGRASSSTTRPRRSRWCTAPTTKRAGVRRRRRVVRLVREARRRADRARSPSCSRARTSAPTSTPAEPLRARPAGHARATSPSTTSTRAARAVVGDPDECIETAKRYEAAGCDLLLCLVNPYKIPHEEVMQSIELLGKHVIPAFAD